jgi:hypothetical protein
MAVMRRVEAAAENADAFAARMRRHAGKALGY